MLPSMPILFSLSRDSLLEGGKEQVNASLTKEQTAEVNIIPQKKTNISISEEIPNYAFESFPEDERECDDELVLLAENTPFNEKRKLLSQTSSSSRKKRKIETLPLLDDRNSNEEQVNHFATAFFMKVKGELDEQSFQKFIALLSEVNEEKVDVPSLYYDVGALLSGFPELHEEFVGFLSSHQSLEVNKLTDFLTLKQTWNFFRKLDPFHFNKLNHLLEQTSTNPNVTNESLRLSLHSLFKGHPNITEGILSLLPEGKPPTSCKEDYEDISHLSLENSTWETLTIQDSNIGRCLPGECECVCHTRMPKKFCTFCNIKFSKGQIYVQTGKGLRFAKVTFRESNQEEVLQRLHPTYYTKPTSRKRTKSDSRSKSRTGGEQISKSDTPLLDNINDSDKNINLQDKDTNEIEPLHLDEDDELIFLEKQLNSDNQYAVSDNLNNDDFIVSEDLVLESTNSEEVEDMEFDSGEEFNMESSPISVKHDEDSFNSCEQIFNEKDNISEIIPIHNEMEDSENAEKKWELTTPIEEKEIQSTCDDPEIKEKTEEPFSATNDETEGKNKDRTEQIEMKKEEEELRLPKVWTREEDKLILQAFQHEVVTEQTFSEISEQLPLRSVDDIQGRFQVLMNLLEKMTSGCYDNYPS